MKKIIISFLLFAAAAMTGCPAVQYAGEFATGQVEDGYELTQEALNKADSYKQQVAEDNLNRVEGQIDFAGDYGRAVDITGLNWLDTHLYRMANFICDLDARGIMIEEVATRSPNMTAFMSCVVTPAAPVPPAAPAAEPDAPSGDGDGVEISTVQ